MSSRDDTTRNDAEARQRQLDEAFSGFRDALKDLLTAEAQQSVDTAVRRLSSEVGTFQVEGVDIEVVIRDLHITTRQGASPAGTARNSVAPARRPARTAPSRRRRSSERAEPRRKSGRPVGPVRLALLDALKSAGQDATVEQLRHSLDAAGVPASVANVHQQLRRLVESGAVVRAGRGVYRVAPAKTR